MIKPVKKHAFLLPTPRLFTRSEGEAYDAIPFQHSESYGDESAPALTAPTAWSAEAVDLIARDAACADAPADLYAIEENTVPSWLWRHRGRGARKNSEGDLRQVFDRAVGSATAQGWKLGLFSSEKHARSFYDEARYALMQRHIGIMPALLRSWGLNWAYGLPEQPAPMATTAPSAISLSNADIDVVAARNQTAPLWKQLFASKGRQETRVTLRLTDIAADWQSTESAPARAAIDIMALRHNDGSVNIDALRHTARLLTLLLDLHGANDVAVTLANLSPLLLALGLAYDSEAGRAMAASLAALVTSECYATSAEIAALRGPSPAFSAEREAIMRGLRNHRRAAYGDGNDYEKLSVLPTSLALKNCPDLALAAEAQRRWDDVVTMSQAFGLRALHVTDMSASPVLAMLMQSTSLGLEPLRDLTHLVADQDDAYRAVLHPATVEALARLDYPRALAATVMQHIAGTKSLRKTPHINATSLRAQGFTDAALERIEQYIPNVNSLRLAVTPWIVGVAFCRDVLKIAARKLESPRFDLLAHLGFSDADIKAADAACYGHNTVRNAKALHIRHRAVFACGNEIGAEARLRMAASVQSFISGDTGLVVAAPLAQSAERGAEITLSAWRYGLKSLSIVLDPALSAPVVRAASGAARRIKAASHPHAKPIGVARRLSQGKKAPSGRGAKTEIERRVRGH